MPHSTSKGIGEGNKSAKLDKESVLEIKRRLREGATSASLAREFKVSNATIAGIKSGRSWSSVRLPGGSY